MTDHDHASSHEVHERTSTADRRVLSPSQVVAGIIGLILVILGGVALARLGFDSLTGETETVLGLEHTTLMALIDIVAGLLFLGAAASAGGRGTLIGLSLIALALERLWPSSRRPSTRRSAEDGTWACSMQSWVA